MKSRLIILLLFIIAACIGMLWWLMRPIYNELAAAPSEVILYSSNGFVKRPGKQAWQPGMTVQDAISAAGGLARFATENNFLVFNDWIGEPRYKDVLLSLQIKLKPVEDIMDDTWDSLSLPGSAPGFGWMHSSKGPRAAASLNTATEKIELLPGDTIFVLEEVITF